MTTTTTTIQDFVKRHGILAGVTRVDHNPNMSGDEKWSAAASHYSVSLKCAGRTMRTFFSQGSAHTRGPRVADVLDCLASDASGDLSSFDSWAADYGYDPDSRSAYKTFETVQKQTEKLRTFLGDEAFRELLQDVERL